MPSFRKGKKKYDVTEDAAKPDENGPANVAEDGGDADVSKGQGEDQPETVVKHKKKKFSFSRKKKPTKSYSKDDINKDSTLVEVEPGKLIVVDRREKEKDGKVRRTQSLVLDEEPDKRKKFWKIHRSKSNKKVKSANTSGADHDTSSVVTNPDMDEWRMSGLLNTVEKSNTQFSSSKNNVSEGTGANTTSEPGQSLATSTPIKTTIIVTAKPSKAEVIDDFVDSSANEPAAAATTKDSAVDDDDVDKKAKDVKNAAKVPENETFVETAGLDYEYGSEMHVSFADKPAVAMVPVDEEAISECHVEETHCAPTFDTFRHVNQYLITI